MPCISIGLPVYNGEKYLKAALDSILSQTFDDFELIISDNASTDRTQNICIDYIKKDNRIKYYCNETNIGATKNFNRVFELSSGKYFRWAAYDDLIRPKYLEKCVNILDGDSSIILCHSKTGQIDEHGTYVGKYVENLQLNSYKPHERFLNLLSIYNKCLMIFGVMRTRHLKKTKLLGNYLHADRNLLAELSLSGRFFKIPEILFFRREHPQTYTNKYITSVRGPPDYYQQLSWWGKPSLLRANFPNWINFVEYFKSVGRAQLKFEERLLCSKEILYWFIKEGWWVLGSDIKNLFLSTLKPKKARARVFRN